MERFKIGNRVEQKDFGKGTIIYVRDDGSYLVEFDNSSHLLHDGSGRGKNCRCWYCLPSEIIKISESFTKIDLQKGDVITLRNGKMGIYQGEDTDIDGLRKQNIEDNLTNNGGAGEKLDIVKVERPTTEYEIVYERKAKPKKMTVAEICEELGYDVEVVKESC